MRELILARECHLECKTEGLDEHNRDGTGGRADREVDKRVLATVLGGDLVDHEAGEDGDKKAVEEEAWSSAVSHPMFRHLFNS